MALSKYISIEGILGAGKSTLMDLLEEKLATFNFLKEPLDLLEKFSGDQAINPILEMYQDPEKSMALFQSYVLDVYEGRLNEHHDKGKVIMDRGLDSVMIFSKLNTQYYSGFGFSYLHDKYLKIKNKHFSNPDDAPIFGVGATNAVIFLQVSPEQALERVKSRNRTYEKDMSLDYLQRLDHLYISYLCAIRGLNIPEKVIDVGSKSKEQVAEEALNFIMDLDFNS